MRASPLHAALCRAAVAAIVCIGLLAGWAAAQPVHAADATLPPAIGAEEPAVAPLKGEDGIYTQSWFVNSFLDLKEDFAEASRSGKRLAVVFEQRGCIYCVKMHTEVLAKRYINDYVRENFAVIQLDMWGDREVTDFDGVVLPEKRLAERWGVMFTPTVIFFKDDLTGLDGKFGQPLEVTRMSLGIGAGTFYDLFVWVRHKLYEKDTNFQRFHITRYDERERMAKDRGGATDPTGRTN